MFANPWPEAPLPQQVFTVVVVPAFAVLVAYAAWQLARSDVRAWFQENR